LYSAPKIPLKPFAFLKEIAVGKTIFLALSWAHVTALLPLVLHSTSISDEAICFVVNRFFFIYAICILFDYRDVEEDKKAGIKSLITRLDEKGIDGLFWGSMVVVFLSFGIMINWMSLAELALLAIPAFLLCLLYYPSKRNFSDYRYYFILDGLMMLSAPLLLLYKFAR
jgi:4-hydroxybenzoate polyprenyltransferase